MTDTTAAVRLTESDVPPAPVERGMPGIRCPHCGAEDSLRLCIADGVIQCGQNDCEPTVEDIQAQITHYTRLLAFIQCLPAIEE